MSKITDELRRLGIFNDHGFCYESGPVNEIYSIVRPEPPMIEGLPAVIPFVSYVPAETGRGYRSPCWRVTRGHFVTDKSAHWSDNGKKTFTVHRREEKAEQLAAALAWASECYGIVEWAKTPFGAYAPKPFVKARLKQLRELAKENP